jgi:hypothetical protein
VFDILMSIWNVIVNVSFSWTIYAIITPWNSFIGVHIQ